jgi:NhaP-type Na+/H+ or K+/H+ antiporter
LVIMNMGLAILAVLIVIYAAVAVKLGRWSVTMPMVFVGIGLILGPGGLSLLPISPQAETVKTLTELTLALLLFADASTLRLSRVREDAGLPGRLLTIGLLLTIALGAGVALLLQPGEGLAFACLLGAILAPTDAALGLPIFNNPRVPVRIRRALNIESGLNDGIATPFVLLFLAFAAAEEGLATNHWLVAALIEIALAVAVGTAVGVVGGWLLSQTTRRGWTSGGAEQLAILGLALAAYFCSLAVGGNGFIAAFVGGIVFRAATRNRFVEPTEFTETFGSFLSLLVWGIFGAVLVSAVLRYNTDWRPIVYAILSLTVVRMVPVALALRGVGLRRDTVALMGWFGPRGLASVVFTLMALENFQAAGRSVDILIATATWTILLSVVLHGLSAAPLSLWYARRLAAAKEPPIELVEMPELPQRRSVLTGTPPQ